MSEECLFCQIVDGDIPSYGVYEDETTFAFLDAHPLAPGHTLVTTKTHHERLGDLDTDDARAAFGVLSDVVPAVEAAVDAPASTVAVNNGEAAGQEIPHVHWHIIPRFADDGAGPIHSLFHDKDFSDEQMERIAEAIRANR